MSDISTLIVDLLRKKAEEKAMGPMVTGAQAPMTAGMAAPTAAMLPPGQVRKAGHDIEGRRAQIEAALAAAR